jgi:hypothetical protein
MPGMRGIMATAVVCGTAVLGAMAPSALAFSPKSATCPTASTVNSALGTKVKSPTSTLTTYSKICTYESGALLPTRISFQEDTAATFAASEKAIGKLGVKVKGLGKGAWTTTVGGDLDVFNGSATLKIVAPGVTAAKLEVLARKIPGF